MSAAFQLVIRTGADQGHRLELKPGKYRLGRGPQADFVIDDATVSSIHCELEVSDSRVTVRDMGSTNGTFIDGNAVTEALLLKPGQILRLGDIDAVLEPVSADVLVPKVNFSEAPAPAPLADGSLACLNHPNTAATFLCPQCQKNFCVECVHKLRRLGGQLLVLCPICSAHCEFLPGKEPKRKKRSIFGRLRQTLKLSSKR